MLFGAVEIIKLKNTIQGNAKAYTGPVVILVNAQSASGSELFAAAMQSTGRATIVGQTTCGCLLGFLGYARIPAAASSPTARSASCSATASASRARGWCPTFPCRSRSPTWW
jgi:hypothetical protein